jgi:hypothetical protein
VLGRSKADLAGVAGRGRRRRGAGPSVELRSRCQLSCHRVGALPDCGRQDPSEIWVIGLAVAALWLLWSEQGVEEVAATPSNKVPAACCSLDPTFPIFLLRSLTGLGGGGISGRSREPGGSGASQSFSSSVRVRDAGGEHAKPASPSSPPPADLGGEGSGDLVSWRAGGSALFLKCGLHLPCYYSTAPDHLGVRSVPWTA